MLNKRYICSVKNPFEQGAVKEFVKIVQEHEKAEFESGTVHAVYSTFSLAKDAEWSTRLFVLDMKEEDEEGIGTFIEVNHHAPALIGTEICFRAYLMEVNNHEVICRFEAYAGERMIASGRTGQKVLKKEKVFRLLEAVKEAK